MEYSFISAGEQKTSNDIMPVINPYDGKEFARVFKADWADADEAIGKMAAQFEKTRKTSAMERAAVLEKISAKILEEKEELAKVIAREAGKPIKDARIEAGRAVLTFKIAAEEAKRINGEVLPFDIEPKCVGKFAFTKRFPIGIILGITPFNFPLMLVAHKVAPAIAAGNPIIIKPASKTPVSALKLGQIIVESGWDAVSVLPCASQVAEKMVSDDRIKMLTFTGSDIVGWALKAKAGKKRVTLELGGNAAAIIHEDADIADAAQKCSVGGFVYAGQVCISLQRIYVHSKIYNAFKNILIEKVKNLKIKEPLAEDADLSCLIDQQNALRVEEWVKEALEKGGKILCGGVREETAFYPTVLENVPQDCGVVCKEVFGPVVVLEKYDDFDEVIKKVNASRFGLQAGLFTNKMDLILKAFNEIEVGGLIINNVPAFRADAMPYGGVKDSGLGREGPCWAIEEMTELKLMVI